MDISNLESVVHSNYSTHPPPDDIVYFIQTVDSIDKKNTIESYKTKSIIERYHTYIQSNRLQLIQWIIHVFENSNDQIIEDQSLTVLNKILKDDKSSILKYRHDVQPLKQLLVKTVLVSGALYNRNKLKIIDMIRFMSLALEWSINNREGWDELTIFVSGPMDNMSDTVKQSIYLIINPGIYIQTTVKTDEYELYMRLIDRGLQDSSMMVKMAALNALDLRHKKVTNLIPLISRLIIQTLNDNQNQQYHTDCISKVEWLLHIHQYVDIKNQEEHLLDLFELLIVCKLESAIQQFLFLDTLIRGRPTIYPRLITILIGLYKKYPQYLMEIFDKLTSMVYCFPRSFPQAKRLLFKAIYTMFHTCRKHQYHLYPNIIRVFHQHFPRMSILFGSEFAIFLPIIMKELTSDIGSPDVGPPLSSLYLQYMGGSVYPYLSTMISMCREGTTPQSIRRCNEMISKLFRILHDRDSPTSRARANQLFDDFYIKMTNYVLSGQWQQFDSYCYVVDIISYMKEFTPKQIETIIQTFPRIISVIDQIGKETTDRETIIFSKNWLSSTLNQVISKSNLSIPLLKSIVLPIVLKEIRKEDNVDTMMLFILTQFWRYARDKALDTLPSIMPILFKIMCDDNSYNDQTIYSAVPEFIGVIAEISTNQFQPYLEQSLKGIYFMTKTAMTFGKFEGNNLIKISGANSLSQIIRYVPLQETLIMDNSLKELFVILGDLKLDNGDYYDDIILSVLDNVIYLVQEHPSQLLDHLSQLVRVIQYFRGPNHETEIKDGAYSLKNAVTKMVIDHWEAIKPPIRNDITQLMFNPVTK